MSNCPLCHSRDTEPLTSRLWSCKSCTLIHKDPRLHLTVIDEKARYTLHTNHIEDEGYVKFLEPVVEEICKRKDKTAKGLDFGSGPAPVLQELLHRRGFQVTSYDPFFSPLNLSLLAKFDFMTCTETAEHFFSPAQEFEQIFALLENDGVFVLMTALYDSQTDWNSWHYANDPTHVCFYSAETLEWIAAKFNAHLEIATSRISIFSPRN